ncbi:acyl-protein thioesterase 2-like [Iris pallida]|uniref:Acyl-protein thioesterase 2-like n=1 Tax=Iris pallida TaxID=29817 RepID=A0AAX6E4Y3_IRIPA|nr:acyl-protein thioesterase 2-like [Iris pallida]
MYLYFYLCIYISIIWIKYIFCKFYFFKWKHNQQCFKTVVR